MRETPSLLCIGNLTIDDTVQGDEVTTALGGDALYAALAARHHLDTVTMLAPFGTDLTPELAATVGAAGVRVAPARPRGIPTVRNRITYAADGSRVWDLLSGEDAFDLLSVYPEDVGSDALAVDAVLVSAMSLRAQLTLGPWLRENTGVPIYLDLQEDYVLGNEPALLELLAACDVFLPSEIEAVTLAGTTDLEQAARLFLSHGPSTVVIKTAERGCLVATADGSTVVATDAVRPVDATGAGDAFCGAFAAVHAMSGDPVAAAFAGAAAARIAIGDYGVHGLFASLGTPLSRNGVAR